jgi:hypothetical protein
MIKIHFFYLRFCIDVKRGILLRRKNVNCKCWETSHAETRKDAGIDHFRMQQENDNLEDVKADGRAVLR